MFTCELCGEVVDRVYRCLECGTNFCRDCGDPDSKKKLCAFCFEAEALHKLHTEKERDDW